MLAKGILFTVTALMVTSSVFAAQPGDTAVSDARQCVGKFASLLYSRATRHAPVNSISRAAAVGFVDECVRTGPDAFDVAQGENVPESSSSQSKRFRGIRYTTAV